MCTSQQQLPVKIVSCHKTILSRLPDAVQTANNSANAALALIFLAKWHNKNYFPARKFRKTIIRFILNKHCNTYFQLGAIIFPFVYSCTHVECKRDKLDAVAISNVHFLMSQFQKSSSTFHLEALLHLFVDCRPTHLWPVCIIVFRSLNFADEPIP